MSTEDEQVQNDINEDLIYLQMYEAILEELHVDEDSGEETPNLDSLSFTKQQIASIRKGGIEVFKEILQQRFRENSEQEQNQNVDYQIIASIDQKDAQIQKSDHRNNNSIQNQIENALDKQIETKKSQMNLQQGSQTNETADAQQSLEIQMKDNQQVSVDQKEIQQQSQSEEVQKQQVEIIQQEKQDCYQNQIDEKQHQNEVNSKEESTNQCQSEVNQQDSLSSQVQANDRSKEGQQQSFLDVKINSEDTHRRNDREYNTHHQLLPQSNHKVTLGQQLMVGVIFSNDDSKNQEQKVVNNPEDIQNNQIKIEQHSQEENYDFSQLQNERDTFNDENYQSLKIDYESISPIGKRDQHREQELCQSYNQQSFSAKNSSAKEKLAANNFNSAQSSSEKNKSNKANKIINDIFSLSGIKVGQFKSITPMGYSSVNLSTSNTTNIRRDYNQSALTQYQYASTSSVKNIDKEDYVTRLYRKQEEIEEKIRLMQEDKLKREQEKYKIEMAKGSQKILSKTYYRKPSETSTILYKDQIEKRQQLLEEKKKEKIESEIKDCTFYPQTLQKINVNKLDCKSINQFYDEQQKWKLNKTQTIAQGQIEQMKKELQGATFHPKINKQSQSIIRDIKVEEKLIQDKEKVLEKQKKLSESIQPLFKPVILPKSQELAKKRKEKEFVPTFEVSSKYN